MPPCLHACGAPPELRTSIFPHLHASTAPPVLRRSIPPFIHVATPAACLRSIPPYYSSILCVGLRFATLSHGAPCGGRAKSVKTFQLLEQLEQTPSNPIKISRLHACSMSPELQSAPSKLSNSYLHVCTPAAHLRHSIPVARPQRASRALELLPPHLHACSAPPPSTPPPTPAA